MDCVPTMIFVVSVFEEREQATSIFDHLDKLKTRYLYDCIDWGAAFEIRAFLSDEKEARWLAEQVKQSVESFETDAPLEEFAYEPTAVQEAA